MANDEIIAAAIARYVSDNAGYEFYSARVDRSASKIISNSWVRLFKKKTGELLAEYRIDELAAPPEWPGQPVHPREQSDPDAVDVSGIEIIDDKRKLIGISGSILLLVGDFSPVATLPMAGSISYLHNGRADGIIIAVISVISLYFSLTSNYFNLRFTGLASLVVISTSLWSFHFRIGDLKASLDRQLAGNPFRGLAEIALAAVRLEWGWVLLMGGGLILLISSMLIKTDRGLALPRHALSLRAGRLSENLPFLLLEALLLGLVIAAFLKVTDAFR